MKKGSKKLKTKAKLLAGLLIDPYRQEIDRIEISPDSDVWRKLLQCPWVQDAPGQFVGWRDDPD